MKEGTQGLSGGEYLREGAAMTEAKIKVVHKSFGLSEQPQFSVVERLISMDQRLPDIRL